MLERNMSIELDILGLWILLVHSIAKGVSGVASGYMNTAVLRIPIDNIQGVSFL